MAMMLMLMLMLLVLMQLPCSLPLIRPHHCTHHHGRMAHQHQQMMPALGIASMLTQWPLQLPSVMPWRRTVHPHHQVLLP